MKKNLKWLILAGVLAVVAILAAFGFNAKSQDQNFTAKVERGDIHDVVEATGTINAVITVQVGSQVSGVIAKLFVDFNSRVHKGDLIALIDPALFQGAVQQADADLNSAKANLLAARANLEKAKASMVQTKADYERASQLTRENITSQQQLDLAKANYDSMNASVGAAVANVTQAEAQVNQKAAALQRRANQSQLHDYPFPNRRHCRGSQCRRRPDRRGFLASTDNIHHRPGFKKDAGLHQD